MTSLQQSTPPPMAVRITITSASGEQVLDAKMTAQDPLEMEAILRNVIRGLRTWQKQQTSALVEKIRKLPT